MTVEHPSTDRIDGLTTTIREIQPHIEALLSQVIQQKDNAAWGKLIALANAATELVDEIYKQDLAMIDRYVVVPHHPALPDPTLPELDLDTLKKHCPTRPVSP
jgi:hypothetical protein